MLDRRCESGGGFLEDSFDLTFKVEPSFSSCSESWIGSWLCFGKWPFLLMWGSSRDSRTILLRCCSFFFYRVLLRFFSKCFLPRFLKIDFQLPFFFFFFFFFKLLDDSSEGNPIEKTWPVNILSRWFPPTLFHVLVTISLHRISSDYLVALAGADFHQLGGLTRVGKWDQYVPLLLCCSGPFRWYRCEMSTAASFQSNTGGDIIWQRGSRHTHTTFRTDRKNLVESNWAGNKWTLIAYGSNW